MRWVAFSFLNSVARLLISRATTEKSVFFDFSNSPRLIQRYNAILLHDCFVKEKIHCSLIFVFLLHSLIFSFPWN